MKNHCIIFVLGRAIIFNIKEGTARSGIRRIRNALLFDSLVVLLRIDLQIFIPDNIIDSGSKQYSLLVDCLYTATAFSSLFAKKRFHSQ